MKMVMALWNKIEPRLIDGWECAYKLMTIWLAAAMLFISTAFDYLPVMQQYLPEGWVSWMAGAIIIARIIKQSRVKP